MAVDDCVVDFFVDADAAWAGEPDDHFWRGGAGRICCWEVEAGFEYGVGDGVVGRFAAGRFCWWVREWGWLCGGGLGVREVDGLLHCGKKRSYIYGTLGGEVLSVMMRQRAKMGLGRVVGRGGGVFRGGGIGACDGVVEWWIHCGSVVDGIVHLAVLDRCLAV